MEFRDMLSIERIQGMVNKEELHLSLEDYDDILRWLDDHRLEVEALSRHFNRQRFLVASKKMGKELRSSLVE